VIIELALTAILSLLIAYMLYVSTRKIWYLETLNPREHYMLGRERKRIVNLNIAGKQFHGVQAGKYTVILVWGTLGQYSKPILKGKLEHAYISTLAEGFIKRKLLSAVEKTRFLDFLYRRIPALSVKGFMITGELISPQDMLDKIWGEKTVERQRAFKELQRRRLIKSTVIWVEPYPPEEKLAGIMQGIVSLPEIYVEHQRSYSELTEMYHKSLQEMNRGVTQTLKRLIPTARYIVDSISDPFFLFGLFFADRARQLEGIGLERLAEIGGMQGYIEAAKILKERSGELLEVLQQPITPKEKEKMETIKTQAESLQKQISELEKRIAKLEKPAVAVAKE